MAAKQSGHQNNRLLAAIPSDLLALFLVDMKEVDLKQGVLVQEAGDMVERIYFPQSGMISLLVVTKDGGSVEAATIGREGAAGLHSGLGKRIAFTRGIIQVAGRFSYIAAARFAKVINGNVAVKDIIGRYTELQWMEAQQIAACNAVHDAQARLCRWLLQTRDRIEDDKVPLTQEFLSQMLGVRRTTVTLLARALQTAGLIKYRRGNIQIVDGKALEEAACECYRTIHQETLASKVGIDIASS